MIFFYFPVFLIADLYEFNTNNCLQASRSTKFCVFFNTKAQSAYTCVAVLTPDCKIFYDIVYTRLKKNLI